MTGSIPPPGPLSYEGQVALPYINRTFNPTTSFINFPVPTVWVNTSSMETFMLVSKAQGVATWVNLGQSAGDLQTITLPDATVISPVSGNINFLDGTGITITGTGDAITFTAAVTDPVFPITPYVVGPSGMAGYQTIQSAIDAANTAGGGMVWVQPGTYTEDLTFYTGIQLLGPTYQSVSITGLHTPPNNGFLNVKGISLLSDTDIFFSNFAGDCKIVLEDCYINATDGYTFDLPNWTGDGIVTAVNVICGGGEDGFFYNTSGCQLFATSSSFGVGDTNPLTISGYSVLTNCITIGCSVFIVSTANVISLGNQYIQPVSVEDQAAFTSSGDSFFPAGDVPAVCIVMESQADMILLNPTITTAHNPAIDGSGTGKLYIEGANFLFNSILANTLSIRTGTFFGGLAKLNNISFDQGTTTLDTDGQLWIGGTGVNPAPANITSLDGSITVTSGTNTIDLAALTSISNFPITPYVVGPVDVAGYQTIQSALDAANSAGGGIIYVQPGTYTEDLTTYGNTQVVGTPATSADDQDPNNVIIIGVHTPPVSPDNGNFAFANVLLQSASDVFSSTDGGGATLYCNDCVFSISGYIYNLVNWVGVLYIIGGLERSSDNGIINNTSSTNCQITGFTGGAGVTYPMITSGYIGIQNSTFSCEWNATLDTAILAEWSLFYRIITLSDNANGAFEFSTFSPQASAALVMDSTAGVGLTSCKIITGNNPAIDGSGVGTLTLTDVNFVDGAVVAGTLTVAYGVTVSGVDYLQNISFDSGASTLDTDGQLWIGGTGVNPAPATLTAGKGVQIANATGQITVSAGPIWQPVTAGPITLTAGYIYVVNGGTPVDFYLPATGADEFGDTYTIINNGPGWVINATGFAFIRVGSSECTPSTGTVSSTAIGDTITLSSVQQSTVFSSLDYVGNFAIV